MAHITNLFRYPLKGAAPEREYSLWVNPAIGVINDRKVAVKRRPDDKDGWLPKAHFYVCQNTALMAAEHPRWTKAESILGGTLTTEYRKTLAAKLGLDRLALSETEGKFAMTDSRTPYLSILNLASVWELSKFVGETINPQRFRMNAWIRGLAPFEELKWVDAFPGTRRITIGGKQFRVDDACERCKAIEANPAKGEYDLPLMKLLDEMMRSRGYKGSPHRNVHRVMGILAVPETPGIVHIDDRVQLL